MDEAALCLRHAAGVRLARSIIVRCTTSRRCSVLKQCKIVTCILPFAIFLSAVLHSGMLASEHVAVALVLATLLPSQFASASCTLVALQHPAADRPELRQRIWAEGSPVLDFSRVMLHHLLR